MGIGWRRDEGRDQSLSIEQCNAIKGISILLVFVRHVNQYVKECGYSYDLLGDNLFLTIDNAIGQLCVVMFLFYSGYGTQLSILKKGDEYVKRIPVRRCLTTLLNFDVAVVVFLVINLLLGNAVPFSKLCTSLVAWVSIGNSNWYIFDIILCYFISFVSSRIASRSRTRFMVMLALVTLLISLMYALKQPWWYDTLLAYPAGAFLALKKDEFFELARKYYLPVLACSLVLFVLFANVGHVYVVTGNLASVMLAVMVVVVTMRVKVQNDMLVWLGKNLFPLYIYQRVPMMVTAELFPSFVVSHVLLFCCVSFVITVLIAFAYKYIRISIN
jgi:hypothetical protein